MIASLSILHKLTWQVQRVCFAVQQQQQQQLPNSRSTATSFIQSFIDLHAKLDTQRSFFLANEVSFLVDVIWSIYTLQI